MREGGEASDGRVDEGGGGDGGGGGEGDEEGRSPIQ